MRPTPRSTRSCRPAWWSRAPSTRRCGRLRSPAMPGGRSRRAAAAPRNAARPSMTASSSISPSISTACISLDVENRTCVVEPGIVLDDLNRQLKKHGLWFPVDVSTASRATIGGMAGNNSCGGRSLRYGTMRDNTLSMDAALADGTLMHFGEVSRDHRRLRRKDIACFSATCSRSAREKPPRSPTNSRKCSAASAAIISMRWCRAMCANNMAHLLVGSEGTLAFTTQVELKLWPVISNKVLGVCHFGSFYEAMDAAQHLVKLRPIAVELVDRTMIALGRDIAMFRPVIEATVKGDPDALLIVEFAEEDQPQNLQKLKQLSELMGDLGFSLGQRQAQMGRRGRCRRARGADRDCGFPHLRPQRHDVDEAGGQAGLLCRGLRGAPAPSRRLHRTAQCRLRQTRHPRHHVCACERRLPACASGFEPEAREGRQSDARHRRGSLRDGARV